MAHRSPLLELHQSAGAVFRSYGPEGSDVLVPEAFENGGVAVEYAALRKHAGLIDQPQRGTLEITGGPADRMEFLNRMVTQELKAFAPWSARRSFWLSRKGRIDADLRLLELGPRDAVGSARMLVDLDAFAAERAVSTLTPFVFAEDIRISDVTGQRHRLALHGPAACALLGLVSTPVAGPSVLELLPGQATLVSIEKVDVVIDRWDSAGVPGLELTVASSDALPVWSALTESNGARPIGWHAYNIARIETGTPLYYLDFGPDSLPHETGAETLSDRVSFKKGCYLGQEVVARMQSLGHPKQRLVGVRFEAAPEADGVAVQPETGTPLRASEDPASPVVGAVTSSTLSPLLSQASVAFAMVKWGSAAEGTPVFHHSASGVVRGVVRESLRFLGE